MKNVSQNFINKVKAAEKKYDFSLLVAWDKQEYESRDFFRLDSSSLDGGNILWSGNQDVVAFMDRYNYSNETNDCQNFKITKKISNRPWGVIQGTATITLNNTSGRFYPGKDPTIGQYVGLPNRPVKIQVSIDGEYVNLFSGYTNRPKATIVSRDLMITAYDSVSYLNTKKSSLSPMSNKTTDQIFTALLLEAGFTSQQFALEPSLQNPIGYVAPSGKNVLSLMSDLCNAEGYTIFSDGDGIIRGWNANHFSISSNDQPDWRLSYDNATAMDWSSTSIINDVTVKLKPYRPVDFAKIVSLSRASDDTLVPASGTKEIWLSPKDDNSAAIYSLVLENPTYNNLSGSNYLTNVSSDGSGATNSGSISLSALENFGDTIKVTFANTSSTPTYITELDIYGTSARQQPAEDIELVDDTSIGNHGRNPDDNGQGESYELINDYIQDAGFAINMGSRIINLYTDPLAKFSVDDFVIPQIEIGDYIDLSIGGLNETKSTLAFGVVTTGGVDVALSQTLLLEQRDITNFFTLDSSSLDGGHVLAL